ncbi:UDP-N-acetyl-2-amino-2-deoxyglucuronate dehydrogenase [Streptomyces sp. V4I23]|uniref:Gfo/Idh/MocA family protein n=1 Tax=Streptomyces sp. V4I23 TaxID=3042282 RepID=UPI002780F38F|nr:Gfo/Idh/MocA family oxidoreductase [Streptomyces sp. V4I23]MDQ1007077.1 UDP-N-acetyl-2-amino-2-deoxyglucuronate dehydrogenase [Streptomyces sp. V4I23]
MSLSASPLRIAIIGVGIIGKAHAQRLSSGATDAVLVAVADADPEAARAAAARWGVAANSVDAVLARDDVDAVIVAVPSGLHAHVAVASLDAGKHVLLEKPIEVTAEAADEIIDAEKRAGKVLSVASQRRFAAENQFVFRAIRDGYLGRITSATIEVPLWRSQEYYDSGSWRGTWALDGGGALMNQGVHLVDLALWLLGEADEVYAHTGLLAHKRIEVEDTITITARLRNGTLLTFLATTAAYDGLPIRYAVLGDGGSLVIEDEKLTRFHSLSGASPAFDGSPVDQPLAQLEDFVTAVKSGGTPLVTSAQARAAVAFIEAAYLSARTGAPVRPR